MKIEERIAEIQEELRNLYQTDNDAPRLIAEMLEEFTHPRGPLSLSGTPMVHNFDFR